MVRPVRIRAQMSERKSTGTRGRAIPIALSVLWTLVSTIPLFLGVLAVDVRCGDSCGGAGWRKDPDAWQWIPLSILGIGAFASAIVLSGALIAGSTRIAARALLICAACWAGVGLLELIGA
jgi:hypothetical protein